MNCLILDKMQSTWFLQRPIGTIRLRGRERVIQPRQPRTAAVGLAQFRASSTLATAHGSRRAPRLFDRVGDHVALAERSTFRDEPGSSQITIFSTSAIKAQNTPHHTRAARNAVLSSRVIAAVNSSSRTKLAQSYKPLGRLRGKRQRVGHEITIGPPVGGREHRA
jgi:hypothetical protein